MSFKIYCGFVMVTNGLACRHLKKVRIANAKDIIINNHVVFTVDDDVCFRRNAIEYYNRIVEKIFDKVITSYPVFDYMSKKILRHKIYYLAISIFSSGYTPRQIKWNRSCIRVVQQGFNVVKPSYTESTYSMFCVFLITMLVGDVFSVVQNSVKINVAVRESVYLKQYIAKIYDNVVLEILNACKDIKVQTIESINVAMYCSELSPTHFQYNKHKIQHCISK